MATTVQPQQPAASANGPTTLEDMLQAVRRRLAEAAQAPRENGETGPAGDRQTLLRAVLQVLHEDFPGSADDLARVARHAPVFAEHLRLADEPGPDDYISAPFDLPMYGKVGEIELGPPKEWVPEPIIGDD